MTSIFLKLKSLNLSGLVVFCVFLFGMWNLHSPVLDGSHDFMHGDLGDSRLVNIQLEHTYQFFKGKENLQFWSPYWSFFPYPKSFSFSDTMLGSMPIYAFFRLIGNDTQGSYQLWVLLVTTLNFWFFFLLLRKSEIAPISASAGSFLFACSLPVAGFLFHMQLMPRFYVPLSLMLLISALKSTCEKKRYYLLIGFYLSAALQIWASAYIGWFFYFSLIVIAIAVLFLPFGSNFLKMFFKDLPAHVSGFFLSVAVLLPLAMNYNQNTDRRAYSEILSSLPTVASWLKSHSGSVFYDPAKWSGFDFIPQFGIGGAGLFCGFVVLALYLGAILIAPGQRVAPAWNRKAGILYHQSGDLKYLFWCSFTASLILVLISLNFNGIGLWSMVYKTIPGAMRLREINRIGLIVLAYQGILISIVLSRFEKKQYIYKFGVLVVLIFFLVENYNVSTNNYNTKDHYKRLSTLVTKINQNKNCKVFYYSRKNEVQVLYHLDAMWASLETGIPTVNGYSAKVPVDWPFWTNATKDEILVWLKKYKWHGNPSSICIVQK